MSSLFLISEHITPLSLGEGLGGEAFIYYSAYNT